MEKRLYDLTDHKAKPAKYIFLILFGVGGPLVLLMIIDDAFLFMLALSITVVEAVIALIYLGWRFRRWLSFRRKVMEDREREPSFTTVLVASEKRKPD